MKKLLSILFLSILILGGCDQKEESSGTNKIDETLLSSFPKHFPENILDALVLRKIIKDYSIAEGKESDLISHIKNNLARDLSLKDSVVYNRISKQLESDEKLLNDCKYLYKVLSCDEQFQSKHFKIYNINSKVDTQQINLYNKQYEALSLVFKNYDTTKLKLVLDTNLNYWRAFPIWDVKYGLLQRYINGNPHELVHHFFTRYSDVPFFQEPVAFLYGDYRNDTAKFFNNFTSYNELLTEKEYVMAKEVWHFPAIVILEKLDKLSFWLFTSTLMQKYGIKKFIEFASLTTWDKNGDDFEKNFNIVYKISLKQFEHKYVINRLKR